MLLSASCRYLPSPGLLWLLLRWLDIEKTGEGICVLSGCLTSQWYVLPRWGRNCRLCFLSLSVMIYWHQANDYSGSNLAGQLLNDQYWSHWFNLIGEGRFQSPDLLETDCSPLDDLYLSHWFDLIGDGRFQSPDLLLETDSSPQWLTEEMERAHLVVDSSSAVVVCGFEGQGEWQWGDYSEWMMFGFEQFVHVYFFASFCPGLERLCVSECVCVCTSVCVCVCVCVCDVCVLRVFDPHE